MSWRQLADLVEKTASQLAVSLDMDKPEVIALFLPNSIDFVVSYLAILHTGHIAFPLDPAYKKLELDSIIKEICPAALITNEAYSQRITKPKCKTFQVQELSRAKKVDQNWLRLPADQQIASLTFTSGTTGKPKAVPNTHANHIWNIRVCSKVWKWSSADSLLISLPLSHWYGIVMGLSGALIHANTLYLQEWFEPEETLRLLSSGTVTFFTHISHAYQKMLAVDGKFDLSNVRLCVSGGAPLPPEVWHNFKNRFGIEIVETYGSSETGRIAANTLTLKRLGSPGKILPTVKVRLNKKSEVLVNSSGLFPGYFRNQTATKKSYTNDGYFKTGDIGELKDGFLFLKGRISERIRRFGYTISPRDIEWAMHQHHKIDDIYVMARQVDGEPDDQLVYFVVGDMSEEEIRSYCKDNLLFAWRPDRIVFLKKLPRTGSGKPKVAEFRKLVERNA